MLEKNKLTSPNHNNSEIFKQFYSLHYPANKNSGLQYKKIRSNSVMAVSEHYNPELEVDKQHLKKKKSTFQKITQNNLIKNKAHKAKQKKQQGFSFKKMLSAKQERSFLSEYFTACPPKQLGSLDELSNRNINIKNAVQKCKDEKIKISKVLISQKQSQQTKMDYLLLKRKEIEEQKDAQIKAIYQYFFKKEYEQLYGRDAFSEFQTRISQTVNLFRNKIFSK